MWESPPHWPVISGCWLYAWPPLHLSDFPLFTLFFSSPLLCLRFTGCTVGEGAACLVPRRSGPLGCGSLPLSGRPASTPWQASRAPAYPSTPPLYPTTQTTDPGDDLCWTLGGVTPYTFCSFSPPLLAWVSQRRESQIPAHIFSHGVVYIECLTGLTGSVWLR